MGAFDLQLVLAVPENRNVKWHKRLRKSDAASCLIVLPMTPVENF